MIRNDTLGPVISEKKQQPHEIEVEEKFPDNVSAS